MARYAVGWVDIADDQFRALSDQQQRLIDARISQLLVDPETGSFHDERTDQWTTTDSSGIGLITYVFRTDRPRLIILRLIFSSPRENTRDSRTPAIGTGSDTTVATAQTLARNRPWEVTKTGQGDETGAVCATKTGQRVGRGSREPGHATRPKVMSPPMS